MALFAGILNLTDKSVWTGELHYTSGGLMAKSAVGNEAAFDSKITGWVSEFMNMRLPLDERLVIAADRYDAPEVY